MLKTLKLTIYANMYGYDINSNSRGNFVKGSFGGRFESRTHFFILKPF